MSNENTIIALNAKESRLVLEAMQLLEPKTIAAFSLRVKFESLLGELTIRSEWTIGQK